MKDVTNFKVGDPVVNLAVACMDAAFVTKLPANSIGQAAVNSLRRYAFDTSKIVRGGDRVAGGDGSGRIQR